MQAEPTEGGAGAEHTDVRLIFDNKTLYIGVVCFDSDPSKIVSADSRRDSSLVGQDSFQLIFDTYHDRQNGFIFGTTPVGLQYDAQCASNEGETLRGGPPSGVGGGGNTGAGAGVNVNWDGSWEVKTRVTETGWTAEFAIPLRTLRYGPAPQLWGLNFARAIERKRELVYWSPVSRIYTLARLSSAGELRGLDVPAPRDLKITAIHASDRPTAPSPAPRSSGTTRPETGASTGKSASHRARRSISPTTPISRRSRSMSSRSTSRGSICCFPRSGRSFSRTAVSSRSAVPARSICFSVGVSGSATMAR